MILNFCRRNIHIVAPAIAVMASIVFLPNATNAANLKTYTFEYCIQNGSVCQSDIDIARGGYITVDYDNSSSPSQTFASAFSPVSQISWTLDKWVDFGFYMDEPKIFSSQTSSYTLPAPTYTKKDLVSTFDVFGTQLNFGFYQPNSLGYSIFGDYSVYLSFVAIKDTEPTNLKITRFTGIDAAIRNPLGSTANSSIIDNGISNDIRFDLEPAPLRSVTPVPLPNFVIGIVAAGVGLGFKGLRHKAKLSKQAIDI